MAVTYEQVRALVAAARIVNTYDVPYLANRNRKGTVVYLDRHLPDKLKKTGIRPRDTLPWHELCEWLLQNDGEKYLPAHKSATAIEKRRVEELGGDWLEYTREMDGYVKEVDDEDRVKKVPPDLDLRPYEDERDRKILSELGVKKTYRPFSDLVAAMSKDMTATDAHATTALGNERRRKRKAKAAVGQAPKPTDTQVDKAGARHSREDLAIIQSLHDAAHEMCEAAVALGAVCKNVIAPYEMAAAAKGEAWSIPFAVQKADPDQQLIFGLVSVVEKDGILVVDKQDDFILPEDLEAGVYDFVLHSRQHGDMHVRKDTGRLVESMVFTREKQAVLGIDLGKVAWWAGFHIDDKPLWDAHKRGERLEFSIGGYGHRSKG